MVSATCTKDSVCLLKLSVPLILLHGIPMFVCVLPKFVSVCTALSIAKSPGCFAPLITREVSGLDRSASVCYLCICHVLLCQDSWQAVTYS